MVHVLTSVHVEVMHVPRAHVTCNEIHAVGSVMLGTEALVSAFIRRVCGMKPNIVVVKQNQTNLFRSQLVMHDI